MKDEPLTTAHVLEMIAAGLVVFLFCAYNTIVGKIRMGLKSMEVPVYGRLARRVTYFLIVGGVIWIVGAFASALFSSNVIFNAAMFGGIIWLLVTWIFGTALGHGERKKLENK